MPGRGRGEGMGRRTFSSWRQYTLVAVSLGVGACRKPREVALVIVTEAPVADLVRRVAGADAEVRAIPRPDGEGRPFGAPEDANVNANGGRPARLAVRVGLGLDDWLDEVAKRQRPPARSLAIGDRVPTRILTLPARAMGSESSDPHDNPSKLDPYVWLDPQRMRLAAKAIGEELVRADGSHAVAYRFRAGQVDDELGRFDDAIEAKLKACAPPAMIADLPSLGYFSERYGVPVLTVLRPFAQAPSASWMTAVRADIADNPQAVVVVTASEIPEEAKTLGRPISHVSLAGKTIEAAVEALANALCAPQNMAPLPQTDKTKS